MVVVGGGPAGSVTALLLARAGWRVELLERREFPRAKPCGDCISPGANRILRRLGLWEAVVAAQPARLQGWLLSAPGAAFTTRFVDAIADAELQEGIALQRETFDAILLDAARAAGAGVRTGVRVVDLAHDGAAAVTGVDAEADGERFRVAARLVVGADGLRSRVARRLGAHRRTPRLRKLSLTAHVGGVPDLRALGEMHTDGLACLGIAPVASGANPLANVTAVSYAQAVHSGAGPHELMRRLLRRFAARDLAPLIRDDTVILASGPFDWPTRRVVYDGAVLVGDAAGYYDPFTGQGIYQAMAGAEALAEHAHNALRYRYVTARSLAHFAAAHNRLQRSSRRIQQVIEYVCARPRLARAAFTALHRKPDMAGRLVGVTGDARPAHDLLSPAVLTRFIFATSVHALA